MLGPLYLLLCLLPLISALTPEEKTTIVDKHNVYRANAEPPAADMKTLRWDKTLEELATSYAAKCVWEHNEERGFRGENLFLMSGSRLDVELGLADWHRERDYYNFTANTCQEGQMCGHYTQMVWADTERVGCGEKFCEKVEGFDESNMFLLVCNYEPPGNFQGENPFKAGDPCSACPPSHICKESLCADKGLEQEETSSAQPVTTVSELVSGITRSQLDPKPTQSELVPEPTQLDVDVESTKSETVTKATQSELDPQVTTSEVVPKATQSELVPEPTQLDVDVESTKSETVTKATQSELDPLVTTSEVVPKATQSELVPEPTQLDVDVESTKSETVTKATQSELDPLVTTSELVPKATPSELGQDSKSNWISTEPVEISTPQKSEKPSPDFIEQTSIQPSTQAIALPSQKDVSMRPFLNLDTTPHIDKSSIDKAFSNDEPDSPTEKEAIIPVTVSVIPTKPAKAHDMSVLVDKNKNSQKVVSQDQARRKDSIQKQPKTSQQDKKVKQKNMNLTSFKWRKKMSSSMRRDYKSGPSEHTYFGRPVHGTHSARPLRPCPYPCLSLRSPLVFPLYRTNHISPLGGYDKQSQMVSKPLVNPSFKQLYKLLGYKRGVYSLYLSAAHQY